MSKLQFMIWLLLKLNFKVQIIRLLGGGWVLVRLGKIKCGAKALALYVGLHLF